jgi:hypothetical protein
MIDLILSQEANLWSIALLAAGCAAAGIFLLPWVVVRLPSDYFSAEPSSPGRTHASVLGVFVRIGKNALGAIFLLGGLMMLVLPGPGCLAMLVGLGLLEFPGKHRLLNAIVCRPSVLDPLNSMRKKEGVAPLRVGPEGTSASR